MSQRHGELVQCSTLEIAWLGDSCRVLLLLLLAQPSGPDAGWLAAGVAAPTMTSRHPGSWPSHVSCWRRCCRGWWLSCSAVAALGVCWQQPGGGRFQLSDRFRLTGRLPEPHATRTCTYMRIIIPRSCICDMIFYDLRDFKKLLVHQIYNVSVKHRSYWW